MPIEDEFNRRHYYLILLSEIFAYAAIVRNTEEGRLYGFHTSDDFLVENLVAKYTQAYGLQRLLTDAGEHRK